MNKPRTELSLPVITEEIYQDHKCFIDGDGDWTQEAVDFACLLAQDVFDRLEKAEAKLEKVQLRLDTCSANCTYHELNEEAALTKLEKVRESLRGYFMGVHLDGHNEHGWHVLPLAYGNMELTEDDLHNDAEEIYKAAALNCFGVSHAVILKYKSGDDGWEFYGVDNDLTELFYGSAADQDHELDQALEDDND